MTEEQLSALLRLKRYEQPPPGYFDRLLQEAQRRQRTELLRRPLWKIAVERVHVFFSEHSMGHLTYAGSMATLLVAGVLGIRMLTGGDVQNSGQNLAVVQPAPAVESPAFKLEIPAPIDWQSRTFPVAHPEQAAGASQPRYIIDTRPASYELSPRIEF